jgi:hypothetical protein
LKEPSKSNGNACRRSANRDFDSGRVLIEGQAERGEEHQGPHRARAQCALDEHRRSMIGMAMVSNDKAYVEGGLSKLVDFVKMIPQVSLIDYQIDML